MRSRLHLKSDVKNSSSSKMSSSSAYERKLSEMREYVPCLERMIEKLERAGDRSKETQLAKMKSLRQECSVLLL